MELEAQAKLLAVALLYGLIEHRKVVGWVDEIIAQSNVAEPWMIDISVSHPQDSENCAYLLEKVGRRQKIIRFTEYVASITLLFEKRGDPLYKCLHLIVLEKDEFFCPEDDLEGQNARTLILDFEAYCFAEDYSDRAVEKVTQPLEELARGLQEKHPEVVEFIRSFA